MSTLLYLIFVALKSQAYSRPSSYIFVLKT
jgi:hypothetical protein